MPVEQVLGSGPGRWVPTPSSVSERPAPVGRLLEGLRSLDRAYSTGHHGRWSGAAAPSSSMRASATSRRPPGCRRTSRSSRSAGTDGGARARLRPRSADPARRVVHHRGRGARRASPVPPVGRRSPRRSRGRTPDACVEIAAERLDATTAMLDGRVLAGSGSSWDDVRSALLVLVRGDPRVRRTPGGRPRGPARSVRIGVVAPRARAQGGRRRSSGRPRAGLAPDRDRPPLETRDPRESERRSVEGPRSSSPVSAVRCTWRAAGVGPAPRGAPAVDRARHGLRGRARAPCGRRADAFGVRASAPGRARLGLGVRSVPARLPPPAPLDATPRGSSARSPRSREMGR